MQSHDGTVCTELKPAYEELSKRGVIGVAAMKAADVSGKPCYTCEPHVEARCQLVAETAP